MEKFNSNVTEWVRLEWMALALGLTFFIQASPAVSKPLMEKVGGFEINWSAQKIRFDGVGDEGAFNESNRMAWKQGMSFLLRELGEVRERYSDLSESSAKEAAHKVAASTYRVKTSFHANGSVRVTMESQLGMALSAPHLDFLSTEEELADSNHTSLVLELDQSRMPSPVFRVFAGGQLVYDPSRVHQVSYDRRLMGKWVINSIAGHGRIVGDNPLIIKAKVVGDRIETSADSWAVVSQSAKKLLAEAKVVVVMPEPR